MTSARLWRYWRSCVGGSSVRMAGDKQRRCRRDDVVNPSDPSTLVCGDFETMLVPGLPPSVYRPSHAGTSVSPSLPMDHGDQLGP